MIYNKLLIIIIYFCYFLYFFFHIIFIFFFFFFFFFFYYLFNINLSYLFLCLLILEPSQKLNISQKNEISKRRMSKSYANAVSQNINKNENYSDKKNIHINPENRQYNEQEMSEQEKKHLYRLSGGNSELNQNYLYQNYSPSLTGRNEYDENVPTPQGRPYNQNSMQNITVDQNTNNSTNYLLNEQQQQQRIIQLYQNSDLPFPIYYSPERELALNLCGWDLRNDQSEVELAIQR